jgi:alkanesulfonate monooxygenase SsuD/methylene tetrahydromethanopterin reductase-like flavin-dependent oxidoreductase (luciferase family)
VEFGVFLNGYIPGPAAHDTQCEHDELMEQAKYVVFADKHNWKYAWLGEHHGLVEYSHMSAPEVVMGWIAAQTDQIHLASGITSLPPKKEHPVRIAERAAMLDHITNNRFEFGTGRGAGSHELKSFNIMDPSETKSMWDEVIREIPRMWEQRDYDYHGTHFTVPTPHNIVPKPYGNGHPAIWVACGNPETFAKAGNHGIGAIAFNFEPIYNLKGRIDAYKEAIQSPGDQIGQFKNDNIMMTNGVVCMSDRKQAREIAKRAGLGYLVTMVNLYHDTMPKSPDGRTWPDPPATLDFEMTDEVLDHLIAGGYMMCGTPDEVSEQLEMYSKVGCDQLVFGLPIESMHPDEVYEMLEIFGDKVIPEHDKNPEHSTTVYRRNAVRKFPEFQYPVQDFDIKVLPPNARIPLNA